MGDTGGNGKNGSLHIGFGQFSLDISASNLLMILIFLGLFALVAGAGYIQMSWIREAQAEHKLIRVEHADLQNHLRDSLDAMTYMISLPEKERPALAMPQTLRHRLAMPEGEP